MVDKQEVQNRIKELEGRLNKSGKKKLQEYRNEIRDSNHEEDSTLTYLMTLVLIDSMTLDTKDISLPTDEECDKAYQSDSSYDDSSSSSDSSDSSSDSSDCGGGDF